MNEDSLTFCSGVATFCTALCLADVFVRSFNDTTGESNFDSFDATALELGVVEARNDF